MTSAESWASDLRAAVKEKLQDAAADSVRHVFPLPHPCNAILTTPFPLRCSWLIGDRIHV
jgi:hypothetical protein